MSKNKNLQEAKKNKNDEFYTRYEDIEKEVENYKEQLCGKHIYCPCDDYRVSNFVKFFKDNFYDFSIKKVTATNYDIGDGAFLWEYNGEIETVTELEGDGDFRSDECTKIKDEADVVITNPPFSQFRDFVKWLNI